MFRFDAGSEPWLVGWVIGFLWAVPVGAFEGRLETGRVPTRPPTPVMHIAEPRAGRLAEPPTRIDVFFQRFEEGLYGSSMELWIDGVEYTESLRFWTDRAWLELPRSFTWSAGPHLIQATVRDAAGALLQDVVTFEVDPLRGGNYVWPFAYDTPNVVANLMEDYQLFDEPEPYWHHGLDIRADAGTAVRAVIGGYVAYRGCYLECSSLQYNVTILGDDNLLWQYSHLTSASISGWTVGERVEQGDVLGNIVTWWTETNGATYNHLHLNAAEWEGFDPDAWRAMAQDPEQTPPAVAEPLSANFKWHNPLAYLTQAGDLDTVDPGFAGEEVVPPPDIMFFTNETNQAITAEINNQPKLFGNVDIIAYLSDERDLIGGLGGQPYTLGLYEIAYSVVPLSTECFRGWIPRKALAQFDTLPGEYDVALQDLLLLDIFQRYAEYGFLSYGTIFSWNKRSFFYNVTNSFYGTINAAQGYWNTDGSTLQGPLFPDGDYRVTVYAKDFAGNEVSQAVEVTLDNGLDLGGFCPSRISGLVMGGPGVEPPGGGLIPHAPITLALDFDQIIEGSARTRIAASAWPAWHFDDPTRGIRVAVGVLNGNEVEVEYVPYLGDVILECPAEVQVIPLGSGSPPPNFNPNAPSQQPVAIRLSTRLARRPDTGQALLGAPHALDSTQFQLVMAEPIDVNGEPWVLRTVTASSFMLTDLGDSDGDGDVDLSDFTNFAACMTGPDNPPLGSGCHIFDFQSDGDVDLKDFADFQLAFIGS